MKTLFRILLALIFWLLLFSASCTKDKQKYNSKNNQQQSNIVRDIDGNIYKTVKIGDQWWIAENLKTTKYSNGDSILNVTESSDWKNLTTGAYCWYNNDSASYAATYGALYNWYAVDNSSGLCPTGWHVPTDAEWTILTDFLGGESVASGHLKETGTVHWNSPNTRATNSSGWTALPGGNRFRNGVDFYNIGYTGHWWSSSAYSPTAVWDRKMNYNDSNVKRSLRSMSYGLSVRCVRNI